MKKKQILVNASLPCTVYTCSPKLQSESTQIVRSTLCRRLSLSITVLVAVCAGVSPDVPIHPNGRPDGAAVSPDETALTLLAESACSPGVARVMYALCSAGASVDRLVGGCTPLARVVLAAAKALNANVDDTCPYVCSYTLPPNLPLHTPYSTFRIIH